MPLNNKADTLVALRAQHAVLKGHVDRLAKKATKLHNKLQVTTQVSLHSTTTTTTITAAIIDDNPANIIAEGYNYLLLLLTVCYYPWIDLHLLCVLTLFSLNPFPNHKKIIMTATAGRSRYFLPTYCVCNVYITLW